MPPSRSRARTNGIDLDAELLALRGRVADLREALRHAREVAQHERQAREIAQDAAGRAWRVASTWTPHPPPIHTGRKG